MNCTINTHDHNIQGRPYCTVRIPCIHCLYDTGSSYHTCSPGPHDILIQIPVHLHSVKVHFRYTCTQYKCSKYMCTWYSFISGSRVPGSSVQALPIYSYKCALCKLGSHNVTSSTRVLYETSHRIPICILSTISDS